MGLISNVCEGTSTVAGEEPASRRRRQKRDTSTDRSDMTMRSQATGQEIPSSHDTISHCSAQLIDQPPMPTIQTRPLRRGAHARTARSAVPEELRHSSLSLCNHSPGTWTNNSLCNRSAPYMDEPLPLQSQPRDMDEPGRQLLEAGSVKELLRHRNLRDGIARA